VNALHYEQLADRVLSVIRDQIIAADYAPGEKLTVHQLAEKLAVSSTPVRDALQRLTRHEYVSIEPRRGTYVTEIDPQDVADLYELRTAVAIHAGKLAGRHVKDADVERLRALADRARSKVGADGQYLDYELYQQAGAEFWRQLIALSNSRRLIETAIELEQHGHFARLRYQENKQKRPAFELFERGRFDIVAALAQHDDAAISAAITDHVARVSRHAMDVLNQWQHER
jgi:DNA-binding GntR family transcriptional regulator